MGEKIQVTLASKNLKVKVRESGSGPLLPGLTCKYCTFSLNVSWNHNLNQWYMK